ASSWATGCKGTTLIPRWTGRGERAAIHIDIHQWDILGWTKELMLIGGNIRGCIAAGEFKDRQCCSLSPALWELIHRGGIVETGNLRRSQATATRACSITGGRSTCLLCRTRQWMGPGCVRESRHRDYYAI